ncbi:MAG TPA: 50S ribosomal protein L4 [Acidimicrobiales bacterium]|nr:50S ribosomal protein L4 [Acidimicrobiales bacterium]
MTLTAVRKDRPAPVARTVVRRDVDGNDLGSVDLEPAIFGIEPNQAVLHQVVTAQLAAARAGTQSTKTRAEVRGGGAKPFRQKGTGRARQGSTRSPSWAGGGVALGPKPRSYRQRTPKKMIRLALRSALSDRAAEDRVALVDRWGWDEPKTKRAVAALDALGLTGKVLVVLSDDDMVAERSFGNLPQVQTVLEGELSAYDILRNDWVVFTDRTLPGAELVEVVEVIDDDEADDEADAEVEVIIEVEAEADDDVEADDADEAGATEEGEQP